MSSSSNSLLRALPIIAFLPLLAACDDHAASATAKPERPVQVERVAFENENATREFVGVVRARYETDLGFRVAGKIVSRVVNVGDRVKVGDVVARLDPQDLKLQVESAEAEFAAATSNLHQAASDFDRYTTLKTRGWASIADFDRKKAAKDEAEGRLERAKRSLDLAHNQLDYSDLKADADGVITATLAEPGQVVAIGQPVVRLAHRGEKEAVVALPETWLAEARSSKATVQLWSGPGRNFTATLARAVAAGRCRDPHLRRALYHRQSRRLCRARHDGDGDAVALRRCRGGEAAARGDPQPWHRPIGLCRRHVRCARAAAGEGSVLHRGHGAGHLRRQQRRPHREARRAEARRRRKSPRCR